MKMSDRRCRGRRGDTQRCCPHFPICSCLLCDLVQRDLARTKLELADAEAEKDELEVKLYNVMQDRPEPAAVATPWFGSRARAR